MMENGSGFRFSAPLVAGGVAAALLAVAKAASVAYALIDVDASFWAALQLGIDVLLCLAFAALAASMLLHRRAGLVRVRVPAVAILILQPMYFLVFTAKYIATFIHYPAPLAWFSILEYYGIPFLLGLLVLGLFLRAVLASTGPRGFLVPAISISLGYSFFLNVYTLAVSFAYWTTYVHGVKFVVQMMFYAFHAFVLLPVLLLSASLAGRSEDASAAPVAVPPARDILE